MEARAPSRLEGKSDTSLPSGRSSSLSSISVLSPGSSFLSYQVSSVLLSSTSSRTSSKANSSHNIGVDCSEQGKPRSNNNLPEGKAKDTVESGSQPTQAEEPTQKPRPL